MSKTIVLLISCMAITGSLVGCGPVSGPHSETKNSQLDNIPPPAGLESSIQSPVAVPPSFNERPSQTSQDASRLVHNLQPLKGVNVDTLFSEKLKDPEQRFERVEGAVVDLRREFEAAKPSIVRLVAVESDIQNLIEQLEVLLHEDKQSIPVVLDKVDMSTVQNPGNKIEQKYETNSAFVKELRVGHYRNKDRIVLDISQEAIYTIDLDNQENLLVIELPSSIWQAPLQMSYKNSPLLYSYSVEGINNGKGSRVIVNLKKKTEIIEKKAIKPGENPNYRVFIDLRS